MREMTAAALQSDWMKHRGLTKGICSSSRAALQAQSEEETSARSCLLCPTQAASGEVTKPAVTNGHLHSRGPGSALTQAWKCHRLPQR